MHGCRHGLLLACALAVAGCGGDGGDASTSPEVDAVAAQVGQKSEVAPGAGGRDTSGGVDVGVEHALPVGVPAAGHRSMAPAPKSATSVAPDASEAPAVDWRQVGAERALLSPRGGLGRDATTLLQADDFAAFVADLGRGATLPVQRERAEVYRQAIGQTLSEVPGATQPLAFACGAEACAGILDAPASAEWVREWRARLMRDQLAPVSTMGLYERPRGDGSVETRFVFTTTGPGRAEMPYP